MCLTRSMPDTVLRLIPCDPTYVPSVSARERTQEVVRRAVPYADDLAWQVTRDVRFVDCGGNFETVTCPRCGLRSSLNDLRYTMPAGFGRCVLEVQNPSIESLPEEARRRIEQTLGCQVRVIWAHC